MTNAQTEARAIVEAGCQDAAERGWFTGTVNARACIAEHVATALAAKNAELVAMDTVAQQLQGRIADLTIKLEDAEAHLAEAIKALVWYENNVAGCRLVHSGGDAHRNALQRDGGERARRAREQGGSDA